MRPTPIPDHEVWDGAVRRVIGPPGGDLDSGIAPVEALIDVSPATGRRLSVRCELEDDDLALLQAGGTVWITFLSAMVPWSACVLPHHPAPGEQPEVPADPIDDLTPEEREEFRAWREQKRRDEQRERECRGCDSRQPRLGPDDPPEFPAKRCPVHGHLPGAR